MRVYKDARGDIVTGRNRPAGGWDRAQLPLRFLYAVCTVCDEYGQETVLEGVEDGDSQQFLRCEWCEGES